MDGYRVVIQRPDSGDHLLVNLAGNEHDECQPLFLIVVLNHEIIEITFIFQVLIKSFYAPYADILEMPTKILLNPHV